MKLFIVLVTADQGSVDVLRLASFPAALSGCRRTKRFRVWSQGEWRSFDPDAEDLKDWPKKGVYELQGKAAYARATGKSDLCRPSSVTVHGGISPSSNMFCAEPTYLVTGNDNLNMERNYRNALVPFERHGLTEPTIFLYTCDFPGTPRSEEWIAWLYDRFCDLLRSPEVQKLNLVGVAGEENPVIRWRLKIKLMRMDELATWTSRVALSFPLMLLPKKNLDTAQGDNVSMNARDIAGTGYVLWTQTGQATHASQDPGNGTAKTAPGQITIDAIEEPPDVLLPTFGKTGTRRIVLARIRRRGRGTDDEPQLLLSERWCTLLGIDPDDMLAIPRHSVPVEQVNAAIARRIGELNATDSPTAQVIWDALWQALADAPQLRRAYRKIWELYFEKRGVRFSA